LRKEGRSFSSHPFEYTGKGIFSRIKRSKTYEK
jgi:hypothetical protein